MDGMVGMDAMDAMATVGIGEAAQRLGVNASALRYYEDRGLVRPTRQAGRRRYDADQLRRLAFVQSVQRLGVSLDAAAAVLDEPSAHWRAVLGEQISALEQLIRRAESARKFLRHALDCPAEHPVSECPFLIETLDRRLAGVEFEELAAEHGVT
jgi:DNA-binding transcriptional MerR regulator